MSVVGDLTVVCLVKVQPKLLTRGLSLSKLPEEIDRAVIGLSPEGLDPANFYLVPGDYGNLAAYVNELAVPYHAYAVNVAGDECRLSGCREHREAAPVVPLFPGNGVTQ